MVTSKFNLEKLNERIGYKVETISRGRFSEVLSSSRGFTPDEEEYFAAGARRAYESFTTKAALSRSMPLDAMLDVAAGRVWTGLQARNRGLVDEIGGLWAALNVAANMTSINTNKTGFIPVEVLTEQRAGLQIPFFGRSASYSSAVAASSKRDDVFSPMAVIDDTIGSLKLAAPESMGISEEMRRLGFGSQTAYTLSLTSMGDMANDILPILFRDFF